MKQYEIVYTEESVENLNQVFRFIHDDCAAPATARIYMEELKAEVERLRISAGAVSPSLRLTEQMGFEVRRLNYKKMAVLFSVVSDKVIILRILPQSMLK